MAETETVRSELDGPVGLITINRPEKRNAFTPEMLDRMLELLVELEGNREVVACVFRGAGGAFCAGADIQFEYDATPAEYREFIAQIQRLTRVLRDSRLFVIAAIDGPAMGGGAELAVACDYRVASPRSLIGFPEVTLGLTVTGGTTYLAPRLIGTSRMLELLLTGRPVQGEQALGMGLVDELDDDPVRVALELGRRVGAVEPGLAAAIKSGLYRGQQSLDAALLIEQEVILNRVREPAARNGMAAFLESRRART